MWLKFVGVVHHRRQLSNNHSPVLSFLASPIELERDNIYYITPTHPLPLPLLFFMSAANSQQSQPQSTENGDERNKCAIVLL